jgi:fructosamine-3-kinase
VSNWLERNNYGSVVGRHSVGGGCINHGAILETASGQTFFLKTNQHNPADMFEREALGLSALMVTGGPHIPEVYCYGRGFLMLEDLKPTRHRDDYWQVFGRQLATLHLQCDDYFGFDHDNYIGSTPQPNPKKLDGYQFFGEHRLLFQARLAQEHNHLGNREVAQLQSIVQNLPELVPQQPASLIHGDLWSGNVMADANGAPAIIDPAAHYGWAEAELAMSDLFGSFPNSFYSAYQELRQLAPGFKGRYPIYNLYHLLNHLNLFGVGYLGQVKAILDRFS